MAAFDAKTVAFLAAQELGFVNSNRDLNLILLIPQALQNLAAHLAEDEIERQWIMTDNLAFTLGAGGAADIQSFIETNGVMLQYFSHGVVTHASLTRPLAYIEDPAWADLGVPDTMLGHYWFRGTTFHTQNRDGEPDLTGDVNIRVPRVPSLANLPDDPNLQMRLVRKVVELAVGQHRDYAQDGPQ